MWASKKAESQNWTMDSVLPWLLFILIMSLVAVAFMYWVKSSFVEMTVVPQGLEQSLLLDRITSPACFSSPALLPQTLDYAKVTKGQMDACYPALQANDAAVRLFLRLKEGNAQQLLATPNWKESGISTSSSSWIGVNYNGKTAPGELSLGFQAPRK